MSLEFLKLTKGSSYTSQANGYGFINLSIKSDEPSGDVDFDRTFANNTPEQISAVSAVISANNMTSSQVAETYGWNIGDTTKITLSTGEVIEMRIIGFNHDTRTGGGKAGITLDMTHCLATKYAMGDPDTNAGGYPASTLKTTTLPTIKATLPQEWQNAIKLVDKKSVNGGSSNYTETVTISEDIFLLSGIEVGQYTYAQKYNTEGFIYEYWDGKSNTNRIKYQDLDGDGICETINGWWLRSCYAYTTTQFLAIGGDGGYLTRKPQYSLPISFAFCV